MLSYLQYFNARSGANESTDIITYLRKFNAKFQIVFGTSISISEYTSHLKRFIR